MLGSDSPDSIVIVMPPWAGNRGKLVSANR